MCKWGGCRVCISLWDYCKGHGVGGPMRWQHMRGGCLINSGKAMTVHWPSGREKRVVLPGNCAQYQGLVTDALGLSGRQPVCVLGRRGGQGRLSLWSFCEVIVLWHSVLGHLWGNMLCLWHSFYCQISYYSLFHSNRTKEP